MSASSNSASVAASAAATKRPATMVGTNTASSAPPPAKAQPTKMHRRSRNGCFTCRLRRKKCDEGSSSCRTCRNLGLKCEYKRPLWWSNTDQRRQQKDHIKNAIKRTKLTEKTMPGISLSTPSPPSLCHSVPTSDTFSDGMACTRAPSVDSQLSFDYPFNQIAPPDPYALPMPPPSMFGSAFAPSAHLAPPYEVDVKTESQMFIDDVPARRDSTVSSFSTFQAPPVLGHSFPADNWIQHDFFESRRESLAEEPLDFHVFDFPYGASSPSHQSTIQVDECDQHLLNHFLDHVVRLIFPILDVNQHGSARSDVILPALESNKTYLHCCLSIAALHLKATERVRGEQIDSDVLRHRYATISEMCRTLETDADHAQILEAALGMILFQCSVGRPDDGLPDISWHQHFQAVTSLVHKLDLPQTLVAMNGNAQAQPPFNMTLAAWIDILGATMLGRTPAFADAYREKLISDATSGLAELMGCDDRIMYLISEIACLEALKLGNMDEVQLCTHIKLLGDQISLSDPGPGAVANAYSSTGALRPKQLSRNMTAVFRLAARVYLCSLVPDFDRTQPSIANLVSALSDAMDFVPGGPDGFDRSLAWPLLVAGSIALPTSSFRSMFLTRAERLGDAADFGSYGRVRELLKDVWQANDAALAKGDRQCVHWRDAMQRKKWEFLLI